MKEKKLKRNKSLYKKMMQIGIMCAVALYCIPELREELLLEIKMIKKKLGRRKR